MLRTTASYCPPTRLHTKRIVHDCLMSTAAATPVKGGPPTQPTPNGPDVSASSSAPGAHAPKEDASLPANLKVLMLKNGNVTYRGDFRAFRDVGGGRDVLVGNVPADDEHAKERAIERYKQRLAQLGQAKADRAHHMLTYNPRIGPFAAYHLGELAASPHYRPSTVKSIQRALVHLIVFSQNARLSEIGPAALGRYVAMRRKAPGRSPGTFTAENTIRNEINAASGLFERAVALDLIHVNPVTRMPDRPKGTITDAVFLSAEEAARLLDAAAELDAEARAAQVQVSAYCEAKARDEVTALPRFDLARRIPFMEAIVATLLYTGGRLNEVLGLTVEDYLRRGRRSRILFVANTHRELKRKHHKRKLECWKPLRHILDRHIEEHGLTTGLLFPGRNGQMVVGIATAFWRCVVRAGLDQRADGKRVTRHALRHTYATHLLHTYVRGEHGDWVERSHDSVAKRLGHRTSDLVATVYGHLDVDIPQRRTLSFERHRRYPVTGPLSGARLEETSLRPSLRLVA